MIVEFRRFVAADADLLVEFLAGEDWPYFAGGPGPEADRIREQVAAGGYGRDGTLYDAIGYAILRSDWETGTVTRPDWDDEPCLHVG